MPFQFSLATVLRIREILEEQEERMLQKILFEIAQTIEAIERIDAELVEQDAARCAEIHKSVVGYDVHASYGQVQQLKQLRKDLEAKAEKLEELRDRQVKIYETARRNREMLTDMRAEKRNAYEVEVSKGEQKVLDDNFIARRGRV